MHHTTKAKRRQIPEISVNPLRNNGKADIINYLENDFFVAGGMLHEAYGHRRKQYH
jgi:hypothetical protein